MGPRASIKKKLIADGKLDKRGKPNENTPHSTGVVEECGGANWRGFSGSELHTEDKNEEGRKRKTTEADGSPAPIPTKKSKLKEAVVEEVIEPEKVGEKEEEKGKIKKMSL